MHLQILARKPKIGLKKEKKKKEKRERISHLTDFSVQVWIVALNSVIVYKLLVLDRNTWNHTTGVVANGVDCSIVVR